MKDQETIILIGAAVAAYFLFIKNKPKPKRRGQIIVKDNEHIEFLPKKQRVGIRNAVDNIKLNPIVDREQYFKTRYKESLNSCSY